MYELKLMPSTFDNELLVNDELSDEALDRLDGPGAPCALCGASQACAGGLCGVGVRVESPEVR